MCVCVLRIARAATTTPLLRGMLVQALGALSPILTAELPPACDDVGEAAAVDNACAAVCRMIHVAPQALPLGQVVVARRACRRVQRRSLC